ncbi:hypothetical protein SteCoe_35611 [Stentor coeruleus]|uniref:Kinesin-like protein n=1 Tax=Stentor coeruleus TaxID=5963 RepID=A0A1R2ARV3_9CILI|nr:hypothetical protein SteCoe_35611 [Stentor coeruleus]
MPTETVKVVVRSRPLSDKETARGNISILSFEKDIHQIAIQEPKSGLYKTFAYDSVYDTNSSQQELYDDSCFPLVESMLQGYNATIFAYGQTGCGKTFTMLGIPNDIKYRGIIPNSFAQIFGYISETQNKLFLVKCSYIEIYNEEIRDLLHYDPKIKLELKENPDKGIFIKNLTQQIVKNTTDIANAMESGNSHRIVKETNMNERSSRSHAIFIIYVETSEETQGRSMIKAGKLNLVDLAGSERQKKTGAEGDRLKEAIKINLSLSALGNVINALVEKSSHVPYRDSKLTLLLQDSLGGNTKTLMVAVVSPADYNYEETLSTLRYASRAKNIQNKPKINEDPKDALLREYVNEIEKLKSLLEGKNPQVIERYVEKVINIEKSIDDEEEKLPLYIINTFKNQPKLFKESSTILAEDIEALEESSEQKINLDRIKEIENNLALGGEEIDSAEKERAKAQRQYRRKLKKQKKREKDLIEEKKKKEEEILNIEKKYQNAQEELEDLRKTVKDLRAQYNSTMLEIKNLNHEFENEKENLYEDIRLQTVENDFLLGILEIALPSQELENIKKKSTYDEIEKTWIVPEFTLDNKQTLFPKIANEGGRPTNILPNTKDKGRNSKKKLAYDEYYTDQAEYRYEKNYEQITPKEENRGSNTENVFREHFQFIDKKKKEVTGSHNELPPVHDPNKKFIADAFSSKKRNDGKFK